VPRKEEVGAGCRQFHDTSRLVLLTECDYREHIKEVERDGACGRYEGGWKCFCWGNLKKYTIVSIRLKWT
jgi:hypothetical protein